MQLIKVTIISASALECAACRGGQETREQHLFSGRLCEVSERRGFMSVGRSAIPFTAGAARGLQIRRTLITQSSAGQVNAD